MTKLDKRLQILNPGNYWTHPDGRIIRERFWRRPTKGAEVFSIVERTIIRRPELRKAEPVAAEIPADFMTRGPVLGEDGSDDD